MKAINYAKSKIAIFIFLTTFFLGSCGYRTVTHSSIIDSIKTVYIEIPKNSTSDKSLSQYLQKAIIDELKTHNIKVVQQKSQAQGYIETNITHYSLDASLFDKEGLPIIYRCTITVNLTLKNKDGKALISNKTLTSFEDFRASNIEDAIKTANSLLIQKVLNRLAVLIREDLFVNF
ncbi:LPS assembly lipoprotein LptE [Desulfurella sp.]|uniref:LPS assembly lipoprotein LptE n=1 Tax=Desulfurella sp. TaxID=1962857 RepID=UPI003D0AE8FC